MTVSAVTTRRVSYTTTGATFGPFAVTFPFFEISVYLDDVLVSPSVYTINQVSPGLTGDLTFTTYKPNGAVVIEGATEQTQKTDYVSTDTVEPVQSELSLDRLTMAVQELTRDVSDGDTAAAANLRRTVMLADADPRTDAPTLPTTNGYLRQTTEGLVTDTPLTPGAPGYGEGNVISEISSSPGELAAFFDGTGRRLGRSGFAVLSPMSYGAVGDGVTDDTAALTALFTAANAVVGGATILIAKPHYITAGLPPITRDGTEVEFKGAGKLIVGGTATIASVISVGNAMPTLASRTLTVQAAQDSRALTFNDVAGMTAGNILRVDFTTRYDVYAWYPYKHSTVVSGVPASGYVTRNNATTSLVTSINIHETTTAAVDIGANFVAWTGLVTPIGFRFEKDASNWAYYEVTGAGTDQGAYRTLPVAYISSAGTIAHDDAILLKLIYPEQMAFTSKIVSVVGSVVTIEHGLPTTIPVPASSADTKIWKVTTQTPAKDVRIVNPVLDASGHTVGTTLGIKTTCAERFDISGSRTKGFTHAGLSIVDTVRGRVRDHRGDNDAVGDAAFTVYGSTDLSISGVELTNSVYFPILMNFLCYSRVHDVRIQGAGTPAAFMRSFKLSGCYRNHISKVAIDDAYGEGFSLQGFTSKNDIGDVKVRTRQGSHGIAAHAFTTNGTFNIDNFLHDMTLETEGITGGTVDIALALRDTGTRTSNIKYSRAGVSEPTARLLPSPGRQNILANGMFAINQRSFGGGALGASAYGFDRWKAPAGGSNLTVGVGTVTLGAGNAIVQVVETDMWLRPNGLLTFQSLASLPLVLSFANLSAPIDFTIGGTSGTVTPIDNSVTFSRFVLGAAAIGNLTLTLTNNNGAAMSFTSVKLEVGDEPTEHGERSRNAELDLCKRYFQRYGGHVAGDIGWRAQTLANAYVQNTIIFPVEMRVAPTAVILGSGALLTINTVGGGGDILTSTMTLPGVRYTVGDVIIIPAPGTGGTMTVTAVNASGGITGYTIVPGINYVAAAVKSLTHWTLSNVIVSPAFTFQVTPTAPKSCRLQFQAVAATDTYATTATVGKSGFEFSAEL